MKFEEPRFFVIEEFQEEKVYHIRSRRIFFKLYLFSFLAGLTWFGSICSLPFLFSFISHRTDSPILWSLVLFSCLTFGTYQLYRALNRKKIQLVNTYCKVPIFTRKIPLPFRKYYLLAIIGLGVLVAFVCNYPVEYILLAGCAILLPARILRTSLLLKKAAKVLPIATE
jgi:hypothetical protein